MEHTMEHQITNEMRECIDNCLQCHAICLEVSMHCLELGGRHAGAELIRTLADCAQSCIASADFMLKISPHHRRYCAACAELCTDCAGACERMANGDELLQRCTEICRRCEATCRQMAA